MDARDKPELIVKGLPASKGIAYGRAFVYLQSELEIPRYSVDADKRIADFRIACSHLESLHSHDAVSVICKGVKGGFTADFMDVGSQLC